MRAAVFEGAGNPLGIRMLDDPAPGAGEVVVKVHRCGICGSDLSLTAGSGITLPHPCVLGHEFAGEVVALGRGALSRIGSRVAVVPILSCGHCAHCRAGEPNRCADLGLIGCGPRPGGYAEYATATDAHCIELPDTMDYDYGALAEPLAVSLRGMRMGAVRRGTRVLVLGAGPIGLAAAYWAKRAGAKVVVTAPSDRRAGLARAMGADGFVRLEDADRGAARDELGGDPEVVAECTGVVGMIDRSIALASYGATIVVLGYCVVPETLDPQLALSKEVIVRFSQIYDLRDYRETITALDSDPLVPRLMITGQVTLNDLPDMFERLRTRSSECKVMIDPQGAN